MSLENWSWICRIIPLLVALLVGLITWIDRKQVIALFKKRSIVFILACWLVLFILMMVWLLLGDLNWFENSAFGDSVFSHVLELILLVILFDAAFIGEFFLLDLLFLQRRFSRDYLNYVSDEIFGVRWHWRFKGGIIVESQLRAFCPREGCLKRLELQVNQNPSTPMPEFGQPISLVCERCGFKHDFDYGMVRLSVDVLNEIQRRVATGEFRQKLES